MKPTILLFDIDGTLVTTGGVGRRALRAAFQGLHGSEGLLETMSFEGMTDRAIVRDGLEGLGLEATPERIDATLADYIRRLEQEIPKSDPAHYRVHVGVHAVLDAARRAGGGYAIGLGTGNVKDGARLKLSHVGLFEHFDFGGFGCDHENRVELIRKGAERGAAKLGEAVDRCRVVVIGDTPKDVSAAHGIGGECVAVGTGTYTTDELQACGAKYVFRDLTVSGAIAAVLGN